MLLRFIALWAGFAGMLSGLPAQATDTHRGLLWEVTSPRTTIYLLGTIHVGKASLYPLPAAIEDAYAAASILAVEADLSSQESLSAASANAMYRAPDNLERHIPAPLFRGVSDVLRGYGLPLDLARAMKPHMLSMALTMFEVSRIGLDPSLGIDLHFAQRAHRDGKRIVELESIGKQIAMLDAMPEDAQVAMLEATVSGIRAGTLAEDMGALMDAWKRGEADELERVAMRDLEEMPAATAQALRQTLYDNRNVAMAETIAAFLEAREVVLVAVGAGHMIGDNGLVALLAARGFTVRQR